MGKNAQNETVEIDRTELTTLLSSLAGDLRNSGSAVRAMGSEIAGPGEQSFEDHERLAASLDRVATILSGIRGHLCLACGLQEVGEQIQFGRVPVRQKRPHRGRGKA